MKPKIRLGEIFVNKGIITQKTLERALERAKNLNQKLGFALEDMGVVTDIELARALADQFNYKIAKDFSRLTFDPKILKLISADLAMKNLIFPLKIEDGNLAIAMADPTDTKIVSNIAANNGLKVYPFIATRSHIIDAISTHYMNDTATKSKEPTILLVEDNRLIYTMVKDILQRDGYRVLVAEDGMEGYKVALARRPHVIITDKEMPKLDGFGLYDSLQRFPETKDIPIFLLTGRTDGEEEARAFEKGFYDFLTKPVREVTLKTRVRRAFQQIAQRDNISFEMDEAG